MSHPSNTPADPGNIRARLLALASGGHLRAAAAEAAMALATRIDAPARVVLLGLPGAGKGALLNHLLGREVLPPDTALPVVSFTAGATPRARTVMADGRRRDWAGEGNTVPLAAVARTRPAMVEVTLPDPFLRTVSLLVTGAAAGRAEQLAAFAWAAPRCDIALWVSRRFDAAEAALWAGAPPAIRDAGYLVLTEATAPEAAALFRATFTATSERLAPALHDAAREGRQSVLDHALLFLRRYRTFEPQAPAPEAPPQQMTPANGARVVALMRRRAEGLLAGVKAPDIAPAVFAACRESLDEASRLLTDDAATDLADTALDAADALAFLEAEGTGIAGAADAVALVLQVRRDVAARMAA